MLSGARTCFLLLSAEPRRSGQLSPITVTVTLAQLTELQSRVLGDWMKEGEESTKAHICVAHGHRQQYGEGQGRVRAGAGWRWAKGGKMRDICNNVSNKKSKNKTIE